MPAVLTSRDALINRQAHGAESVSQFALANMPLWQIIPLQILVVWYNWEQFQAPRANLERQPKPQF